MQEDDDDDMATPLLAAQHGVQRSAFGGGGAADAESGGAAGSEEELQPFSSDVAADAQPDTPRPPDDGAKADVEDACAQYARLAAVLALLLTGYGATRLACLAGLPDDAGDTRDGAVVAADLYHLLQMGSLLTWLTGLTSAPRFSYFRSRPVYALVFLCTGPVFAGIGEVPGLQVSLATVGQWGALAWVVMLLALGVVVVVVHWHARHAWRALPRRERAAYLVSRAALHALFVLLWAVMRLSAPGRRRYEATHFHHFFIGFLLATWGAFNHPLSATLLAVGAGIFVQGISAYHFAWMFFVTPHGSAAAAKEAGCIVFRGNASAVACAWDTPGANATWGLIMCPMDVRRGAMNGTCSPAAAPPRPPLPPPPPSLPPWPPWPPLSPV